MKVLAQLNVNPSMGEDSFPFLGPLGDFPKMAISDKRAIRVAFGVPDHMACNPAAIARFKWEQNGRICHYCEKPVTREAVTADHIIPLSRGGSCRSANIVPSCMLCNGRKGNRTLREWQTKNFRREWANGPDLLEIIKNTPRMITYQPPELARSA